MVTSGFIGAANVAVVADVGQDSFDILSLGPENHTAMGMNIVSFNGGTMVQVRVLDKADNPIDLTFEFINPFAGLVKLITTKHHRVPLAIHLVVTLSGLMKKVIVLEIFRDILWAGFGKRPRHPRILVGIV